MNRTHFAFNPTDLDKVNQMGYENYLDWMLALELDPAFEAEARAATIDDEDFPSKVELSRWWTYLMTYNPNAFQERLALFWHDHFAASADELSGQSRWFFYDHANMWRVHGLDPLGDLLYRMATDPTMLIWLDGYLSTKNSPNDNFAREFWELFTLGADNGYTEADIAEASRVFTGYRRIVDTDSESPTFNRHIIVWEDNRHDNTDKTIFGIHFPANGQEEYRDLVNFTMQHGKVAEHIVTKVWEEFVYERPGKDLVKDLAKGLRESDYDLRALFKRVFMSRAFYSDRAKKGMVKSPVEHHIGFMRTTGLKLTPNRANDALTTTGQQLTQPPTVNGWPKGMFWMSSQAIVERANFLRECVFRRNDWPQAGYDVGMALIPPGQTGDLQVVARLAWLLQVELTPEQRDECVAYLNKDRNSGGVIDQPWDFDNDVQREKKIRGLLYILAQHPDYHTR